jgi:hypothetical protein
MDSLVDLTLKFLMKGEWVNKKDIERYWSKQGAVFSRGRYAQSSVGPRINDVKDALNDSFFGQMLEFQEREGKEVGSNPKKQQFLKEYRIVPKSVKLKTIKRSGKWDIIFIGK